jgi:Secretion system C-terminal sorting domain
MMITSNYWVAAASLYNTSSLMNGKIDSMRLANIAISTDYMQEANAKTVTNIYWQYIGKGNLNLREGTKAVLMNIAAQCPLTGGKAVYQARMMTNQIGLANYFDDRTNCQTMGYNLRTIQPNKATDKATENIITLSPNPTKGNISLSNAPENANLIVRNMLGQTVFSQNLLQGSNSLTLPLSVGTYIVTVQDADNQLLHTTKLVLIP